MHSRASGHTGGPGRATVSVKRVESVPETATVRDYDQLAPAAMATFPEIVATGRAVVSRRVARELETGEIVKFTDYYRVGIED